jgi:hypothetical protein
MAVDESKVRWSPAGRLPTVDERRVFDALFETVALSTVIVIFYDEADCELKHGTGTCILARDRTLIATAGHHFVREPIPAYACVWSPTIAADRLARVALTHRVGGNPDDPVDLALLEIDPHRAYALGTRFLTLDRVDPFFGASNGEHLFICGYGGDPSRRDGEDGRVAVGLNVSARLGTAIESTSIAPRHRPAPKTDIFMLYPRAADDPTYEGLSGAGIWSPNFHENGWTPRDARLVGIQHEALQAEEWVRATRIEHLLTALAQRYPDVRDEVEGILSRSGRL